MDYDAMHPAGPSLPECHAVTWKVARKAAPGILDTTGWLEVGVCTTDSPCREVDVDIWENHVAEKAEWKRSAHGPRLHPLELKNIRARLPRANAALLLVVAHEDPGALVGNLKLDPWFDTETRVWRAEPVHAGPGCDRWAIELRIGDAAVMRWVVDLTDDSVSRGK